MILQDKRMHRQVDFDTSNKVSKSICKILIKIDELNENINSKKKEIENLLSFLQVSNGENVYLEYIFEAKTFTDFIYRSAVV